MNEAKLSQMIVKQPVKSISLTKGDVLIPNLNIKTIKIECDCAQEPSDPN